MSQNREAVVEPGRRVAITWEVLAPAERPPGLPEDTAACPYQATVRGILLAPSRLGEPARIRTAVGREREGVLAAVDPSDDHGFGRPHPALVEAVEAIARINRELP